MQEVSPMRPCIHLLLLHKLINIIKLGSPDKLGGKILNFPEKVIPLCHE